MKTALVADWIIDIGGAEQCIKGIYSQFNPDVFTLISKKSSVEKLGIDKPVKNSFIKKLPKAEKKYRNYFMLYPLAVESFDVSDYDVIISSSHAVAKGVLTTSSQLHICYCYTPIRYAWDLYHQYLKESGYDRGFLSIFPKIFLHYIRIWDYTTANRVNHFIAISDYIGRRIKKVYNRDSVTIYPPVDVNKFTLCTEKEDYYVTASRMVPYKKIDLIVESFTRMPDKKLVVIGDGPQFSKVKKTAKGYKNITIMGYQEREILLKHLQKAKAFVFAAEEDFGIIPVEAQACGTPVIAYIKGGVRETVIESKTGIFFDKQTPESIIEAVNKFEKMENIFNPHDCRKNAEKFSEERFKKEIKEYIEQKQKEFFS